ncbi:NAD(P)/FAD-dependent oxidoreductase [Nibricoccus aquaticus]|nr:FAD-binding oxidoreductase [Nibricoccus aquaticus]
MDLISGCPFWIIKNGILGVYPTLRENVECEVAIIGGGVSGALIGYRLAEAGIDAVMLDKRDIGTGSTAASTSLLQYETDLTLTELSGRMGEENAVRVYRACRAAVKSIGALARRVKGGDFTGRDSLYLANTRREVAGLKREFELRRKHGFDVSWWTRKRIAGESSLPHHAAIESHDAAEIDAFEFTHAVVRAAAEMRKGLRVFDRTAVTSWKRVDARGAVGKGRSAGGGGGGFVLTTADGFRVKARRLVVAAGYESLNFFRKKPAKCHSTYALVTEPLETRAGWPGERLIWETARPYIYARTTADGRAIIGGYDEEFRDPQRRDALLVAKTGALQRRFGQLFPEIRCDVAFSWTGTFAETKDSLPYIGEAPGRPGIYFALGYGGNGVIFSALAAEIIRAAIVGERNALAELFRFGR